MCYVDIMDIDHLNLVYMKTHPTFQVRDTDFKVKVLKEWEEDVFKEDKTVAVTLYKQDEDCMKVDITNVSEHARYKVTLRKNRYQNSTPSVLHSKQKVGQSWS